MWIRDRKLIIRDIKLLNKDVQAMRGVPQTIRSGCLQGFPEVASTLGLDAALLMRRAGLPSRCLNDLSTPISLDGVCKLLESSAAAAGVEDVGLRLARQRRLSNLGPMSLALREEPTGLQALETLGRYMHIVNAALATKVEHIDQLVFIRSAFLLANPAPARQAMEMTVGMMYQTLRELMGAQWRPRRVCFAHRAPGDTRAHHDMFGTRVEFDAAFNGMVCDAHDLHRELPRTDPDMARFAREYLDHALGQARRTNVEVVRQLVSVLMPAGRCTVDQVAQHLKVSRRTVHRWLLVEGETFSRILCQARREFAQQRLVDRDVPVEEMAQLLGFSSGSAFAHWFHAEFGCSAGAWRRARLGRPGRAKKVAATARMT